MRHKLNDVGLVDKVICDSAGTGGYHSGEPADARMQEHGLKRGYNLTSKSRKLYPFSDFVDFDYILAMDHSNYQNILAACESPQELDGKLKMMCDYCTQHDVQEVPDPYFGGDQGFEFVYNILEDACDNLLKEVIKELD